MRRIVTLVAVVAACLLVVLGDAIAADQVRKTITLPAELTAAIGTTGCSSSPGPQITLQGDLALSGLKADVVFSNFMGATPQQNIVVEQVVVPENHQVGIPGQSVVGVLSDNPFIWLQLTDKNGRPLTSEIFLGRCDQGQFNAVASIPAETTVLADVTASECTSSSGPLVSMDGQAELQPIHGKLIFRSSDTGVGVPQGKIDEGSIELVFLPAGQTFQFPQQAAVANSGGNPLIGVQLRQGDGEPIGSEIRLGRCGALSVQP